MSMLIAVPGTIFIALALFMANFGGSIATSQRTWHVFVNNRPAPLFYQSGGVAVGPSGDVYVADSGSHRVDRFSSSGILRASWGTDSPGPLRFDGPRGIAVDALGDVYLADNGVVKLSPQGRFLARWTGGVLQYPRGLAVDARGDVFVLALHPVPNSSMFDLMVISKLSASGRHIATYRYVYTEPAGDSILGAAITVAPGGNLLISIKGQRYCHSCDGTYYLLRTVSPAGKTISDVPETAGGESAAVDTGGSVYLTQAHSIQKLSPSGTLVSTFGEPGCSAGALGDHLQISASARGGLYIADTQVPAIRSDTIPAAYRDGVLHAFTLSGSPIALYGTCPAPGAKTLFGQISALAPASDGGLFVADAVESSIDRFSPKGKPAGSFASEHPFAVATDRAGNVYVPNLERSELDKRSPSGTLLTRTTNTFVEAIAVGGQGRIYGLTPFGQVSILPRVGHGFKPIRQWFLQGYTRNSGGLDPEGICLDGQGNIWVADIRHNNIQEYLPTGRLLRIWGRQGTGPYRFHNPTGLTVDGRGHLFVVDSENNRLQEYDLRGHFIAAYGRQGQAPGQFNFPLGIASDRQGNIYVGDRGNDRVQVLRP